MDLGNLGIPIVGIGVVLALVLVVYIVFRNWIQAGPDELAVIYGRGKVRYMSGGGRWKVPVMEKVKRMSLAPFEIKETTQGIYSNEFVLVDIDWVALVRFNGEEGAMQAGAQRFLSQASDKGGRETIEGAITEILHGMVRAICAGMKVEQLNQDREQLQSDITDQIEGRLTVLGLQLDSFSIQNITDNANVLVNLGAEKAATADRDARIARAVAVQAAREREAAAAQAAQEAEARAMQAIAVAERDRDVRMAELRAETQREQAKSDQAGPLATALAQREVVKAEQETRAEAERGRTLVEMESVKAEQQRLQATEVEQALADARAVAAKAEGESAAIERRAAARRIEAAAEAFAAGEMLRQEADGKQALAAALNAMEDAGQAQTFVPLLIEALPKIAAEFAKPYGDIDEVVIIDSGTNGEANAMDRFAGKLPGQLAGFFKTIEAVTGINLVEAMKSNGGDKVEVDVQT